MDNSLTHSLVTMTVNCIFSNN